MGEVVATVLQVAGTVLYYIPGLQTLGVALTIAGSLIGAITAEEKKPQTKDISNNGHLINTRSTQEPLPIVYGKMKVGGNVVYLATSGDGNKYLHMVVTLSEGEIEGVETVYLDDKPISDYGYYKSISVYGPHADPIDGIEGAETVYGTYAYYEVFRGTSTQGVCETLRNACPEWQDPLRDTAYLYIRLEYNADKFTGMPTVTAVVKGRKVYDPRTGQIGWSDNGALATYDYITNDFYGARIPAGLIDIQSIIDTANIIDAMGYKFNGAILERGASHDTIDKMLANFRGILFWTDGKYKMKLLQYDSPVMSLTEDDIVQDSFHFSIPGLPETPSKIRVKFPNLEKNYVLDDLILEDANALLTLDEEEIEHELTLIGTTSYSQAYKLAVYNLERQRLNKHYGFIAFQKALPLEPGDTISITHSLPGWTNRLVRVRTMTILPDDTVALTVIEETAYLYDDTINVSPHTYFETNLPSPTDIANVTSVSLSESLNKARDGTISVRLIINFIKPGDIFYDCAEIYYREKGAGQWIFAGTTVTTNFEILGLAEGRMYEVKIVSVSIFRVRSSGVITEKYLVGKALPPSDVSNFWAQVSTGGVRLSWDAVPDIDISHYLIRWSPKILGATWDNAIYMGETSGTTITFLAAKSGTYFIKAVDTSGNESRNATAVVTDVISMLTWNIAEILTENPLWAGTKTNIYKEGTGILLDVSTPFDSWTDFDAVANFDRNGDTASEGFYEIPAIDLGSVQTSRISATIDVERINYEILFDDIVDFDAVDNFDGDVVLGVGVDLQIATSQDGSTWSGWQNFIIGDYKARAYKFRLRLWTNHGNRNIKVNELSITIDMPDREESWQGISIPANGQRLIFATPFTKIPTIRVTIHSANPGDYYYLTGVSETGINIQIKNSFGEGIPKTIDVIARGY